VEAVFLLESHFEALLVLAADHSAVRRASAADHTEVYRAALAVHIDALLSAEAARKSAATDFRRHRISLSNAVFSLHHFRDRVSDRCRRAVQ